MLPSRSLTVAGASERVDRDRRKLEAAIAGVAGDVRRGLEEIRSADPKFDMVDFVVGARVAFEMIVGAFAQGDTKALRPLLADQVFANRSEERRVGKECRSR